MKRCTSCGQALPFDRFYKRSGQSGRQAECKTCMSDKALKRYHADPGAARERHLIKTYGITLEEYEALLDSQGGGCALCGAGPDNQQNALHLDHDHATGERRGILCLSCNTALGRFHDSPALLEGAKRLEVYAELVDLHAVECPHCGQPRPRHLEGVDGAETEGAA